MSSALVIGADSLVGRVLAAALTARGVDVTGTTRRHAKLATKDTIHLDLADPIPDALPDVEVAYICAAMTKLAECRLIPDLARRINFEAPLEIAARLVGRGTRVVFLSTAAVLDCREPRMLADRPREGRSLYGKWKASAEAAILDLGPKASVLRLTKILTADTALFRNWVCALREGETIEAFDDHRVSPLGLSDVVDALVALRHAEGGIYQVSGARDVSFFDMASYLATALRLPRDRVLACHAGTRGIPADETTRFTSLDCSRLATFTGFEPPEPYLVLDELFIRGPATSACTEPAGR